VLLSATDRETTRGLIEAVAAMLATRWDESASVPELAAAATEEREREGREREASMDGEGQTTLEEMHAASGRRARKVRGGG